MGPDGVVVVTLGDLVCDVLIDAAGPPVMGADVDATIEFVVGGSSANFALAAARLGAKSRFVGATGADLIGSIARSRMKAAGVEVCGPVTGKTGIIAVLIEGETGDRAFLSHRGSATDLSDFAREWREDAMIVHVPYYTLAKGPLRQLALRTMSMARECGIPLSLDLSSSSLLRRESQGFLQRILLDSEPSFVFGTEDEWACVDEATHHHVARAERITKRGPAAASVSIGLNAVDLAPPERLEGSTNGAGDAFAAGYLLARIRERVEPAEALRQGHLAAADRIRTGSPRLVS